MRIQEMFYDDIDRKINGVVKVDQDAADVLKQEVKEYVITRDIRKHMITFFNNYAESFREPTADVGVWISGFFGSGKSHFLKMLSYLLENKEVDGKKVEDYFREKFDDEATFMQIASAIRGETDTILFNIDIEGSINKDKTAVLRVFAKMFYNYLGFYGENLKCAKMEQFIDKKGKTEEFRRVFEEKNGSPWVESRDAFAFFEDDVVDTLVEVLGMSETAAHNWFDGTETVETSIAQLVSEMKEYVEPCFDAWGRESYYSREKGREDYRRISVDEPESRYCPVVRIEQCIWRYEHRSEQCNQQYLPESESYMRECESGHDCYQSPAYGCQR